MNSDRRFSGVGCWLWPALLGAALYVVNLPGTWIYDDLYFAHEDPRLADVHQWKLFLTQPYMDGGADNLWRPLVSLSFAVQHWAHPTKAWPFHLVNLLLHGAVCGMVATLGRRLTGQAWVGLIAGLLFAAHPIHVEAVSGIVGRAEEMCAMGVLGAMLLVIGNTMTPRRAMGVTGCFIFAALSKEQGILLPFMLLGWWWVNRSGATPPPLSQTSPANSGRLLAALLTCALAGYISYRNWVANWYWDTAFLDWQMNPIVRSAGVDRWLMPVAIFGRYTALLLVPWRLAPDYSARVFTPAQAWGDVHLWIGFTAAMGAVAWLFAALRRRNRVLLFCLGCFGVTYFLASNIVIIGTIFGERLMYLPSVFLCILAGMGLARARGAMRGPLLAIILAAYCIRTETYAWQWNDRARFYAYAARVQPKSGQIYLLWGDELEKRRGDLDGAEKAYAMGREACPGYWRLLDASARLAMTRGRFDEASAWGLMSMKSQAHPSGGTVWLLGEIEERRALKREGEGVTK